MTTVATIEGLFAQLSSLKTHEELSDFITVIEDALREGVTGAGRAEYCMVQPHIVKPAELLKGHFAVVTYPKGSDKVTSANVRLVGAKPTWAPLNPRIFTWDRTFELGNPIRIRYNFDFTGNMYKNGAEEIGYLKGIRRLGSKAKSTRDWRFLDNHAVWRLDFLSISNHDWLSSPSSTLRQMAQILPSL